MRFSDNSAICHVWASGKVQSGKHGNILFEHGVIYSYGKHFPIAKHLNDDVVLVTTAPRSMTTARHCTEVRRAVSHKRAIFVADPEASFIVNRASEKWRYDKACEAIASAIASKRRKSVVEKLALPLQESVTRAVALAEVYNEPSPVWAVMPADLNMMAEQLTARLKADSEARAAALEAKRKELIAVARKDLARWRKGGGRTPALHTIPVALRITGDAIETSHGASTPSKDVPRILWLAIKRCNAQKKENVLAYPYKLGHFSATRITAKGELIAGCHTIPFRELARVAEVLFPE